MKKQSMLLALAARGWYGCRAVRTTMKATWITVLLLAGMSLSVSQAAVLYVDTFSGPLNWGDRDAGEMAVSLSAGFGSAAPSLRGTFAADIATPESDAFRVNSGPLLGNYSILYPTFTSWSFSFYSDNILPSDLRVRFGDGLNTFSLSVGSQVTAVDQWFTVTVPLTYAGWFGGSGSAFTNAINNVSFIDVQVTRNGTAAQTYYLDNFGVSSDLVTSVPEPATGLFWFGAVLLYGLRRHASKDSSAA